MTRAFRLLGEVRERWAARPERPGADWLPRPPAWLAKQPRLAPLRVGTDELYARGEVVWAWVLMANQTLWAAGTGAAPGEVLWSDDLYFAHHPDHLGGPASRYWELKRGTTTVPGLSALVAFAQDEHRTPGRRRFPTLFSHGRVIWHDLLLVYREHLPMAALAGRRVPLVRVVGGPETVAILPVAYWPRELVDPWIAAAPG